MVQKLEKNPFLLFFKISVSVPPPQKQVGSIADYDPMNGQWGTVGNSNIAQKLRKGHCLIFPKKYEIRELFAALKFWISKNVIFEYEKSSLNCRKFELSTSFESPNVENLQV